MSGPDSESKPAHVSKCVTIAASDSNSVTESKPTHVSESIAIFGSITIAFSESNSVAEPKPVAQLGRGA